MAVAKKVSDIAGIADERAACEASTARRAARMATLSGKTFETLVDADKDLILKMVSVCMGLLPDSEDAA